LRAMEQRAPSDHDSINLYPRSEFRTTLTPPPPRDATLSVNSYLSFLTPRIPVRPSPSPPTLPTHIALYAQATHPPHFPHHVFSHPPFPPPSCPSVTFTPPFRPETPTPAPVRLPPTPRPASLCFVFFLFPPLLLFFLFFFSFLLLFPFFPPFFCFLFCLSRLAGSADSPSETAAISFSGRGRDGKPIGGSPPRTEDVGVYHHRLCGPC